MRRRHDRWGDGSLSRIFGCLVVSAVRDGGGRGTVCTGFGRVGWVTYGDDGCVVEADAFTEGDGVVC